MKKKAHIIDIKGKKRRFDPGAAADRLRVIALKHPLERCPLCNADVRSVALHYGTCPVVLERR